MRRRPLVPACSALVALAVASGLEASSNTAGFNTSTTVSGRCVVSTMPLAFGEYDPLSTHSTATLDAASAVSVACTKGVSATIVLDAGTHASGSTRRMANGTNYLTYDLFQDAAHLTRWSSTGSQVNIAKSTSMSARSFAVHGVIAAGQVVPAGDYSDSITVTVNY
ncbi:MAG: spore coat U domain-containing protein [Vicinamibacterales bacterium]